MNKNIITVNIVVNNVVLVTTINDLTPYIMMRTLNIAVNNVILVTTINNLTQYKYGDETGYINVAILVNNLHATQFTLW